MSREIQQSNKAPRHHNDNFESDKRFIETVAELRLRMKTIQLGYTLPKNWIEKWGIQNLRVYYSAENLLTFDDMPINVDPETVSERLSSYPLNKTHSFGVNITF